MSIETEAHPASGRLFDNRVVVLGWNYPDAAHFARRVRDEPLHLISAGGHLGAAAGMRVARVYVTPSAHRGRNYDEIRAHLTRHGAEVIHLTSEGETYAQL